MRFPDRPPACAPVPERFCAFTHRVAGIGEFRLYPLDPGRDAATLHAWVANERARFWGMQDHSRAEVARVYQEQVDGPHSWPYLGHFGGEPAFLLETYDPAHDVLAGHYTVAPGDVGMHFLVAPPRGPGLHGFTRAVMQTILAFLFSDPRTRRVVVEPDVRNEKIHALNRAAGFRYEGTVALPHKTAALAFCMREDAFHPPALEALA